MVWIISRVSLRVSIFVGEGFDTYGLKIVKALDTRVVLSIADHDKIYVGQPT